MRIMLYFNCRGKEKLTNKAEVRMAKNKGFGNPPTPKEYLVYVTNRIHNKVSELPRDQFLTNSQMLINNEVLKLAIQH